MKTCQCFSFSRLALVMKRDWMENWKEHLYTFLGLFFAFIISYLVLMGSYEDTQYPNLSAYISNHAEYFLSVSAIAFILYASFIMKIMQRKESRLSYLMLPATMLEKFVARGLFITVILFLMVILATLLAEVVHWLFMPMFDLSDELKICVWPEAWGSILHDINPFQTMKRLASDGEFYDRTLFALYMMMYSLVFWWHSLYVLGGNIWHKWSWVKTTSALIVISLLMVWTGINFNWVSNAFEGLDKFVDNHDWFDEQVFCGFLASVFFIFTALNWWLSYKLFTRSQVIQPKFRLL